MGNPGWLWQPEAACAFAKAVTSVDAWVRAATERARLREESGAINTGVYSGNILADEAIFEGGIVQPIENEAFQNGVDVILSLQENAFAMPANPAGAQFQQAWQDAVNRVLNGVSRPLRKRWIRLRQKRKPRSTPPGQHSPPRNNGSRSRNGSSPQGTSHHSTERNTGGIGFHLALVHRLPALHRRSDGRQFFPVIN